MTQFLGAFNDNLFKSALVILITFHLAELYDVNAQIMITAVAGLFILPFFLFSSLAGQIADKYEKSFLIRIIKFVEIVLMCLTAAAFETMHLWWLVFLLFCMGTQSTFFGPLKFSILPQLLNDEELVAGNGLVNAGTNIAILTGTLCGGLFILSPLGRHYISAGVVGVAVAGYAASRFIPLAAPSSPKLRIDRNLFRSTWEMLVYPLSNKDVFRSIIGISWFWFLGSVFLAQFPSFAKDTLGGDEQVSTLFLVIFSVGVGAGATLCNKLLKGRVSGRYLSYSLIGMSVFIGMLYMFSASAPAGEGLMSVWEFLRGPRAAGIVFSMFMIALSGGLYSVPMYAMMQRMTPESHMARVIASLNIIDSLGMVLAAALTALMIAAGMSISGIFFAMAFINLLMLPLTIKLSRINYD
ncbi:MFS transporter [Cloacibacillus porcorum]|uniref:MFS transporter n=1 Tax=Cloacibacillus porcorum TaxID=1197717 RepID=UPI0014598150|nr:MFS transporter [Cloacibacillus porcorum]MCC8185560.1 MFS transporter [Cloacibacillus porcorum]MDD7650805.1 MFS transporter [Cloacibacillus porcorum]MDY4094979.1 MFS transporter [Cloacibacillus porcorum]MDY5389664.1 MFS transporter [Cloacibacillus porcorum]NMF17416.1 MFS transporter [Cloacibacillus porcorum]